MSNAIPTGASTSLRVPSSLGCKLGPQAGAPLQWIFYEAEGPSHRLLAWLFAPAAIFEGARGVAEIAAAGTTVSYRMLSNQAEAAILKLQASRSLSSHLVPILNTARSEDGLLWMTTPLSSETANVGFLGIGPAHSLARGLTSALASLHGEGLLHLDVHPEMAILDGRLRASLRGFGVDMRRAMTPGATTNLMLGRPGYSAPELWDASGRSPLGPWTDIYGAAATLFFCCTGASPDDFRERVKAPELSRIAHADRLLARLGHREPGVDQLVEAIMVGLSPRIQDRPADIAAWVAMMALPALEPKLVVPPTTREAVSSAEASRISQVDGSQARSDWREKRRHSLENRALESEKRWRTLRFRLFLMLAAIITLALASAYALWRLSRSDLASEPLAAKSVTAPDRPAPEPTVRRVPSTPYKRPIPIATAAGVDYRDDPDLLTQSLSRFWGPAAAQAIESSPSLYFRPFREQGGSCDSPLRLHLRSDGQGLVIVRPTGLVWATSWDADRSKTPGRLTVKIASVHGEGGEIDVPGLSGTSRRVEVTKTALTITFLGSGQPESETYLSCEGSN